MRDGKQFIREHTIPRDPKTPAQLAQRAKISLVNKGLSPLNKVIKQNYPNNSGAYRSLIGKTIRECVVGAYPDLAIDYSRILLSEGEVLLPDHVTAAFQPDTGQITLNWDRELPPGPPGAYLMIWSTLSFYTHPTGGCSGRTSSRNAPKARPPSSSTKDGIPPTPIAGSISRPVTLQKIPTVFM
jgi:hypothetical protein